MLNEIFPQQFTEFSTAELNIIAETFANPTVRRYLLKEAAGAYANIASGMPKPGQSAEEYLRLQASVAGGLGVINALLSIRPAE